MDIRTDFMTEFIRRLCRAVGTGVGGGLRVLKEYLKLKTWLNFNAIIVFILKIKNLRQFSEKKSR